MNAREMVAKRTKLHEDIKVMLDRAEAANRAVTPAERETIARMDGEIDALTATLDARTKSDATEKYLSQSRGRQIESIVESANPDQELALRAWALGNRASTPMIEAAERIGIRHQNPALELRALSVGSAAAGGNSVGNEVIRSFYEAQKWYGNVRNVATVIRTDTGATLPWPTVDDTSNTGRLLTEGTGATTTTDPSFGVVNLSSYKFSSDAVILSAELLQDSSIPLGPYLGRMLGTRVGRIQNTYFTTGSGTSQPGGVQVKASLGKTAAATNAITFDEVIDLFHSLDVGYRSSPSTAFMVSDPVAAYLRKLKDSQNRYLWEMSLVAGQPDRMFGKPVILNNDMDSAFTTNKRLILFGDFSKYVVRDAGDVQILRSDDLYILSHQAVFLAYQRSDGNLCDTSGAVKYLRTA